MVKRLRLIPTRSGFLLLTDRPGKIRLLELAGTLPFNRYCHVESTVPGKQAGWRLQVSRSNAPRLVATLVDLLGEEFDFVFCPVNTPAQIDNNCATLQLDAWLSLLA